MNPLSKPADSILIRDLAVAYHIGVTDNERATPQKLLLSLEMDHELAAAAESDDLAGTIDYSAVCRRLLAFGDGREWKLIETLAVDIAKVILMDFKPRAVTVEVKKFVIPDARYVAVRIMRSRSS